MEDYYKNLVLKIIFLPMNILYTEAVLSMERLNKDIYTYDLHYNMAYVLPCQFFYTENSVISHMSITVEDQIPKSWVIWFRSLEFRVLFLQEMYKVIYFMLYIFIYLRWHLAVTQAGVQSLFTGTITAHYSLKLLGSRDRPISASQIAGITSACHQT